MHGIILTLLQRCLQIHYDYRTWVRLIELSGLGDVGLNHQTVYSDEHIYVFLEPAVEMTSISAAELREKFGDYLVFDLTYMYQRLLKPEWKTLGTREHTENLPPVLEAGRLGSNELMIDYVSLRRMGRAGGGHRARPGRVLRRGRPYRRDADHQRGRQTGPHSRTLALT